jgi:hypothetical protein
MIEPEGSFLLARGNFAFIVSVHFPGNRNRARRRPPAAVAAC